MRNEDTDRAFAGCESCRHRFAESRQGDLDARDGEDDNCVELCRIHLVYTPNRRGGGDDAGFQSIIVAPGHGDDPRCVCRRPIVISFIRGMGDGVVVMSLEGGVLCNLVGGVIGRARAGGGRLGHGGIFVFFLMSQVFFLGEKKRGGGKNKV